MRYNITALILVLILGSVLQSLQWKRHQKLPDAKERNAGLPNPRQRHEPETKEESKISGIGTGQSKQNPNEASPLNPLGTTNESPTANMTSTSSTSSSTSSTTSTTSTSSMDDTTTTTTTLNTITTSSTGVSWTTWLMGNAIGIMYLLGNTLLGATYPTEGLLKGLFKNVGIDLLTSALYTQWALWRYAAASYQVEAKVQPERDLEGHDRARVWPYLSFNLLGFGERQAALDESPSVDSRDPVLSVKAIFFVNAWHYLHAFRSILLQLVKQGLLPFLDYGLRLLLTPSFTAVHPWLYKIVMLGRYGLALSVDVLVVLASLALVLVLCPRYVTPNWIQPSQTPVQLPLPVALYCLAVALWIIKDFLSSYSRRAMLCTALTAISLLLVAVPLQMASSHRDAEPEVD